MEFRSRGQFRYNPAPHPAYGMQNTRPAATGEGSRGSHAVRLSGRLGMRPPGYRWRMPEENLVSALGGGEGVPARAERAEVGPVLLDVIEAGLPGVLAVHDPPTRRHRQVAGPQRVLLLVVHEHQKSTIGIV